MLKVHKILSHLVIILGSMFLIFFCIDRVNTAMAFIDNEISKWLLFFFSLLALGLAIINLVTIHRRELREKIKDESTSIAEQPPPFK